MRLEFDASRGRVDATAPCRAWAFPLTAIVAASSLPLIAPPADVRAAGAYVVNATDDVDDGACDGIHCSLREAMNAANAAAGGSISFTIPGVGPHVISPATSLPIIRSAMTIDGYTQPGSSPNTRRHVTRADRCPAR